MLRLHLVKDLHEFLAGDGFALDQELCDAVQRVAVLPQDDLGLLVAVLQDLHHLTVHLGDGGVAAVHFRMTVEIDAFLRGQAHQAEFLGHAVLRHHGPGNLRGLLDVV